MQRSDRQHFNGPRRKLLRLPPFRSPMCRSTRGDPFKALLRMAIPVHISCIPMPTTHTITCIMRTPILILHTPIRTRTSVLSSPPPPQFFMVPPGYALVRLDPVPSNEPHSHVAPEP